MWQVVVLIPKGKKDYRGIDIVEVTWKSVAAILNCRLTASIIFHEFLQVFQTGCSIGNVTLKANLLQQLSALTEEVLYVTFLEPHKAYDALNSSRCHGILEGYNIGPQDCWLLQTYWRRMTMVARAGGYYGAVIKGACGVTQGDPLSPTILNVVVDPVARQWVMVMVEGMEEWGMHGKGGRHQNSFLYADDDMVALSDPRWL